MKAVSVAFYGLALGLLAIGLRELLTGFEENRCSMTYMFEYPEYRRVALPRRVARLYPAYGLYLYGEGLYAQETRNLKLSGAPVLFLPGNAGSHKQARSLGSIALRKAENMEGGLHFNVFTVDFNEELVALYGGSLRRQTHFLHESIKAILRLYKHLKSPPQSVVLVGHSMGGVVARALFTLPKFNTNLVTLIITQASPHMAPVLGLDPFLLDFYKAVRQKWLSSEKLKNVIVLSVGGGYRDFQVRSGLTSLPCSSDDPNKISLVVTAVPRTWVSTDHLSIVWCKELVLATVRAFFDLLDPTTRQFIEDPEQKIAVLNHHFVRHPVSPVGETHKTTTSFLEASESWSEVNTLRLAYTTPNEGQVKYFLFALSSRRKAYSHFYCRSSGLQDLSSWVYGCMQKSSSSCVHAVDLSIGTEYLPPYKVLVLDLNDLSAFTHLVVAASNVNVKQFTVECEWQRQQSQTVTLPVPHVLSLGMTVSDVTISSSGLLHNIQLHNFHQVYQAFRITVASQCKMPKERLSDVYRLKVPWFREDSLTTISAPSVTEISGMLHTSRPDNSSCAILQLHTAPNCQYKVTVRTSLPKVLGQVLRFCGPMVPVYTAVTLLLACGRQLNLILKSGHSASMSEAVARSFQLHKVILPVYVLHVLLSCSWFEELWSLLRLPQLDSLTPTVPDSYFTEDLPAEEWPYLLSPLLYVMGATVAFWGSALLRVAIRVLSLLLALLHRPSVSRDCGTLPLWTLLLITASLTVLGSTMCAALSICAAFTCHLYRVLRLQMTERSLSHMLNLAPQKHKKAENGTVGTDSECLTKPSECNGTPLLSETVLQDVRGDLQLHLCLSVLFMVPVILSAPSLLHWLRNMRYSTQLDPDPCWPHFVPLIISYLLLINCNTERLAKSKLLRSVSWLPLPLAVVTLSFSTLHLYRITYFLSAALVPMALCCLL